MKKQVSESLLLGFLSISVLLSSVGTSMANIALPAIASEFGTSFANGRWIVLCYLLASTVFSLIVGRWGDLNGQRNVLLAGTVLFSIGTFACGYSPSFIFLILSRVIQGIGGAVLLVLPAAIAMDFMPKEKTGKAIGLLATMSAIGTAAGPSLGGFILDSYSWRFAFFLMTAIGLFSFCLLQMYVPNDRGLSKKSDGTTFIMVIKSVYSDSFLSVQLIYNFIVAAVMMTTLITGPFYLSHGLHLEPAQMGLIMSVGPVTSAIFGVFSGFLVDRYGSLRIIKIGILQLLIGTFSFVFAPWFLGAKGFALSAFLLSLGYQLFLSANSSSIMKKVSSDRRGFASGAISLSRNLGLISGAYFMGGIFDFFAQNSHAKGLRMTFLIASIFTAFLLIHYLKNQHKEIK